MSNSNNGLTPEQRKNVENFLDLFSNIEGTLKGKLGLKSSDRTPVASLIDDYEARNPYWQDSANRLRRLKDIRNVLTHQRCVAFGYPIAVALHSIEALHEINGHLTTPEPASKRYRRKVQTVSALDPLAAVLTLAYENGFSQFPVMNEDKFGGLVTEAEITRWLGRRVKSNSAVIDMRNVCVKTVLKEKDPTTKGLPIFHFRCLDTSIEEVMGMFSRETALQVVLLTKSGGNHTPIEGIITQWDAARFRSPVKV